MQGPLGEDPTRISTRSSVEDVCRIMEGPLRQKCSRTQCLRTPRRRRCASLRRTYHKSHFYARISPKNKTHRTCMSLEPFYTRIYKNNAAPPRSGHAFCASLHSQNAHGYVTRAIFMRKSHFMREFAGKNNAGGQSTNPDLTSAFHLP